jgi:hypothetical protein
MGPQALKDPNKLHGPAIGMAAGIANPTDGCLVREERMVTDERQRFHDDPAIRARIAASP